MPTYQTPGIYFERPELRLPPAALRTDVAGFVGVAERGPLDCAVRLTDWRQFQQTFGGFLPYAHLAYVVRGFFENGGRACWVVRIAGAEAARTASTQIPAASGGTAYRVQAVNPGTWGNNLAVSFQGVSLGASQHTVIPGLQPDWLAIHSIAGFEPGSWVLLTQRAGAVVQTSLRVARVDETLGVLVIPGLAASGLDPADAEHPISVQSQEFILLVWQAEGTAERFPNLAPDPQHPRFGPQVVNSGSLLITLERLAPSAVAGLPVLEGGVRYPLGGGINGLRSLAITDYTGGGLEARRGLALLEEIQEVSVLVMPDLTARPQPPPLTRRASPRPQDPCDLDLPVARIELIGRVLDVESDLPLPGVRISDGLQTVNSAADGTFGLANLLPGRVDLLFTFEGFEELILPVIVANNLTGQQDLEEVKLTPLDLPPILSTLDIFSAQSAMIAQCQVVRNRFALLDSPLSATGELLDASGLLSWRSRFDTAFAAMYYPWLRVTDPLQPDAPQGRLVPPGGHIAGVIAATDLAQGVFRAPANRALAWVDDVGGAVDDALQGLLNARGINAIRSFPGRGIRPFGARTLSSSQSPLRFVNVRRLLSYIEASLYDRLQWAVFEPNSSRLWTLLRTSITGFLDGLWRQGAFLGNSPEAAYFVHCDASTTPPELQAAGQVVVEVGVAPTVPYEFVVIRLGITNDELLISEVTP